MMPVTRRFSGGALPGLQHWMRDAAWMAEPRYADGGKKGRGAGFKVAQALRNQNDPKMGNKTRSARSDYLGSLYLVSPL
jgi:hypothetical protein